MTAASSTLLPIVLYLALSFVVALWAGKLSRKHENASGFLEEYFLGSRSMGGFVLAMTVVASYTSASSFIGGPGVAYTVGLSWVLLAMIQMPTVFLTIGVLGKRFAMEARAMNAVTITDYLRVRYGSDAVAILCSLALLVFFVAAMTAQFIGGARLFQAITGYPYEVGLALFGITVIAYTALGGFRAVVLTDAMQGIVMTVASVVVLLAVVQAGGGMEACMLRLKAIDPGLITPTGPKDAVPQPMILSFWVLVGLGVLGLPQTSQRCMGYKDSRAMHSAMIMGTVIIGFLLLSVHLAGALGRAVIPGLAVGDMAMPDTGAAAAVLGRGLHRRASGGHHVHGGLHAAPGLSGHHQGSVCTVRPEGRQQPHAVAAHQALQSGLYGRHRRRCLYGSPGAAGPAGLDQPVCLWWSGSHLPLAPAAGPVLAQGQCGRRPELHSGGGGLLFCSERPQALHVRHPCHRALYSRGPAGFPAGEQAGDIALCLNHPPITDQNRKSISCGDAFFMVYAHLCHRHPQ